MANGTVSGELNIQGLEAGIDRLEKKMNALSANFTRNSNNIIKAFQEIGTNGIDKLISKIGDLQAVFSRDMLNTSNNVSKVLDGITALTTATSKLKNEDRIAYKSGAVAKIEYEIEEKLKALAKIQQQLNFYAKGEGSKAIGFGVDTSKLQSDANKLMSEISLLDARLAKEKEIAQEKGTQIKSDEANTKRWIAMEKEKQMALDLSAKKSSESAKANSVAAKKAYDEKDRMYRQLWSKADSRAEADVIDRINKLNRERIEIEKKLSPTREKIGLGKTISPEELKNAELLKEKLSRINQELASLRQKTNITPKVSDTFKQADASYNYARINESEKRSKAYQDAENKRYQDWLKTKSNEENIHKQVEQRKTQATAAAIAQQIEDFAAAERKKQEIRAANDLAKKSTESAKKAYEEQLRMYDKMFQEVEARRAKRDSINRRKNYNDYVTSYEGAMRTSQKAHTSEQELQAIKNLEQARDKLSQKDKDYATKLNALNEAINRHEESLKEATLTDKQRAKISEENSRKAIQQAKREKDIVAKQRQTNLDKWYSHSPQTAMDFSKSTQSINDQIKAIQYLKSARDNLNRGNFASEEAYRKKVQELNDEIKRQQAEVDKLTGKNGEMGKSHRSLMDTAGQLQRKLALLFSVSAIKGYVNKLIEVRGEFEMQQRSLQSLLGDVDAANKIWDKTVALAVKSPFTVRNLVTYTKQLAAYRVESNKLYETNKMLADVSAGLGVDMSRLILAFGQVKAATVLRGTELRQFTEAGVNMLSELATLYTELEGRMVSTADVFERISKKMVAFEDVEEVFKRLTSEGGLFYEMQEKQSETLIGMQRNLKDSVDLMINSIGQANDGVLKWGVSLVREMVENWRVMAYTIKMLIPAMAALGISKFIAGWKQVAIAGEAAALAMNGAAGAGARMNVALKNIGKTIKAHPILSLLSVAAALGLAIWELYKAHSAENEQYNEANRAEVRKLNNLIELNEQTKDYNAQIKQSEETMKKMGKGSKEYAEAQTICNTAQRENEKIMAKIRSKYPELLEYIDQHKNGVVNLTEALEAQRAVTQLMVVINEAMKADTWITDGFREDIGDASKAQAKFKNEIVATNVKATEAGVKIQELYAKLGDDNVNLTAFEKMFKDLEKAKTLEEVEKGVNEINKAISLLDASMTKGRLTSIMNAFNNQYTTLVDKNETYKSKLAELSTVIEEVAPSIERTLSNIYDTTTDEGKKSAGKMLTMILEQMGLVDKEMKEWARTEVTKNFRINVIFEDKETEGTLDKWQQNVKDEIEKLNKKLSSQGYATITLPKASDTREQYQNYIKGLYDGNESVLKATKVIGQKIYDEDQKIEATVLKDIYKAAKKVVGLGDDKKDSGQSIWEKRISIIKELRKEYDDLNKTFDKNTSKQKILEGYADAANGVFKGLGISIGEIPFDDLGKLTEFVDKLMDKTAKGSNDYIKLGKLKGSLEVEIETEDVKEKQEKLIKGLEEDFDKYELGLELEKLNLPKDFIKNFFDVDVLSLEDLRKKVENFDTTGFGKDALKDYQKLVDKINEMDEKAQAERLKTYLQYARESVGERAKIKLEELKKLQEIERTFKPLDTDTEEVKKQKQQAKTIATKKVKDESEQATKKLEWEEFQKSDMFLMIFEDLESASGTLIESTLEKLKDFKKQWADMPLESVRAMTDKINQLESALLKLNNPFKAVGEIDKSINKILGGQTREQINQEALESQQKIDQNNVEIGQLETIRELMLEGKTLTQEQRDIYTQTTGSIHENVETLNEEIEKRKGDNKELDKSVSRARQLTKAEKDKINAYNAQADAYNNINKMANDLYNASKELVELFAGDDSIGVVFADMGMSMANSVLNTLALQAQLEAAKVSAQGFGAAMNAAMGVIGWIVMAIQLVSQAVSAVIKAHDQDKQKEIDEEAEAIRRLEKEYEKLEKGIEDAYSLTTLKAANELAEQNLKMQRNHYREMQRLEEEKKNTDKEKIKDYQDSIDEIGEQIEQLQIDRVSEVTAGILDSAKDAARDFVDAWLDAFNETGDGLSGLKDSFKEITLDMVKQQASLLIAGTYLDRWKDMLSQYITPDDLELTSQEAAQWIDKVQQELPKLNEQLEAYFRAMEQAGVDLDGTGEQLSGLQKGIQGITEAQADIIAAYLNSIRFYVADSNVKLNQLLAMQTNEEIPNPMLSQLKIIASQTTAINTLLGSVTKSGHSAGGRGIKVFIS